MPRWEDKMRRVNARLVKRFSYDVILHLSAGDKPVIGVFDNPFSIGSMPNGGTIRDSVPELFLQDSHATDVKKDLFITISGQKWQVVKTPEPDGTGLTKITLGHTNGETIEAPTIRYRS